MSGEVQFLRLQFAGFPVLKSPAALEHSDWVISSSYFQRTRLPAVPAGTGGGQERPKNH